MQDMYRLTLAAYWTAQPGDLKADDCIEDIFAGGDGWGDKNRPSNAPSERPRVGRNKKSRQLNQHQERRDDHSRDRIMRSRTRREGEHQRQSSQGSLTGERTRLGQRVNDAKTDATSTRSDNTFEVDELECRENLRSWKVPGVTT